MSKQNNEWRPHVDAWVEYQLVAGTPATTIGLRRYHVRRVADALGGTPTSLTYERLSAWLAGQTDWSPNTRRSYRSSLRAFYGWAIATGRVRESPAHLLPPVRIPRAKPRPAPEQAYRRALGVADDRARLGILLAGACGLRRGEIARTHADDLERDLLGWALRVRGKGGHVRLVPLPDEVVRMVAQLEGWWFPSSHGRHLTPHYLGKLISENLPDGLTTHTLRHRCATVAYDATRDLRAVQELLGHAKPETTALYTAVPDRAVRDAMRAASV